MMIIRWVNTVVRCQNPEQARARKLGDRRGVIPVEIDKAIA